MPAPVQGLPRINLRRDDSAVEATVEPIADDVPPMTEAAPAPLPTAHARRSNGAARRPRLPADQGERPANGGGPRPPNGNGAGMAQRAAPAAPPPRLPRLPMIESGAAPIVFPRQLPKVPGNGADGGHAYAPPKLAPVRQPAPIEAAPQPAPMPRPPASQPAAAPPAPPREPPAPPRAAVAPAPEPMPPAAAVGGHVGRGELAGLKAQSDLSNCVLPLLEALNWRGDPRHVAEAVPHFVDTVDITSFRNMMATLHFESRPVSVRLNHVDPRLMPCLFLPEGRDALLLLGLEADHIRAYDGGQAAYVSVPRARWKGTAYFFRRLEEDDFLPQAQKVGWMSALGERFRSLFYQSLGLTLILNILALVTPLFVMAVYDKVIATGSMSTLAYLAVGVGIAITCDLVLREVRTRITSFIGARLDNIVGTAIFRKILFLPPAYTERASVGAQVARIKDFETIREFFTGPMALMIIELPFTVVFFLAIAFLAGPLVLVPIVMLLMFVVLSMVFTPLVRSSVGKAGRASSKRQELVVETLNTMRAVKYCGAEPTWLERYRNLSARSSLSAFVTGQLSSLVQTTSQFLMTASGVATIVFGVFRVLEGTMTVGALVATMILVWRVLAPLQMGFISITRLTQVKSSISQINNLMNIRAEREAHTLVTPLKRFQGYVSFNRVSLRYSPDADPALVGVSFEINPGEIVTVVGGNGSGKSTVLKLLAGIYVPQAGNIRIDNQDIRQMDVIELRHAVGYVPQTFQFFYGTIAQNLRLAYPTATDADLRWACEQAGVLEDVLALEQGSGKWKRSGFEVRLGDSAAGHMPTSLLQRLNLARGYLKRAPIMLFDEPGNGLDFASDQKFMATVEAMRGTTTVFIVTHRPSHLRIADKILWLEQGAVKAFGPAAEVRKQMPKDLL